MPETGNCKKKVTFKKKEQGGKGRVSASRLGRRKLSWGGKRQPRKRGGKPCHNMKVNSRKKKKWAKKTESSIKKKKDANGGKSSFALVLGGGKSL